METLPTRGSLTDTDPMTSRLASPSGGSSTQQPRKAKRKLFSRAAAALLLLGPAPALLTYGCDSPTQFDDLCGWLRDPNNCYREMFIDVGTACGVTGTTRSGAFATREPLSQCFLNEGGIINFSPPLSVDALPGTGEEVLKIKILNQDMTECSNFEFRAKYDFKATFTADTLPPEVDPENIPEEFIIGGTFNMAGGKDSDTLNVTCPDPEEKFKFDRLQITRCREYEEIIPHIEIQWSPGGIDENGVIRLNVFYPPFEGDLDACIGSEDPDCQIQPVVVNYFDCVIPAAPPLCANGVKDGTETDIDCGGNFCTGRCFPDQLCLNNSDCEFENCIVSMGQRKCGPPPP